MKENQSVQMNPMQNQTNSMQTIDNEQEMNKPTRTENAKDKMSSKNNQPLPEREQTQNKKERVTSKYQQLDK